MNNIVEVNKLGFAYHKELVLDDVSFSIKENDFVGIIGPNGGGKTTLVKILLGLLRPRSGEVKMFGNRPGKDPHKVAYLPQNLVFDPLIPITVEEVVLMGCLGHRLAGFFSKEDKEHARSAMKTMNVLEYKNRFFSSLSGGQKQRVLIARALTCHPKLLILDEPSSGIDHHHEKVLLELLKELNKEMAVAMVSHEYHFVSSLVDYVVCVNHSCHIHHPHEITKENFQELISKKYQFVSHEHEGEG